MKVPIRIYEQMFSRIKILDGTELIKYKNKIFLSEKQTICASILKKILNICSKYSVLFNE